MENNNSLVTDAPADLSLPKTVTVILNVLGTIVCLIYLWLIFSILLSRRLRDHSNLFLASLLVIELVCILLIGIQINLDTNFPFPKTPMLLFASMSGVFAGCYFSFSVVVAADRYFKIAKPMQYLRLMSNKVCACIIIVSFGLLIVTLIGSFVAHWHNFDSDFVSVNDLYTSEAFLHQTVILMDSFAAPSLLMIGASVVALARIARKQQRKIDAERINLGTFSTNGPQVKEEVGPIRRPSSHKLVWYSCTYFATIVIAWVPNLVTITLVMLELVILTRTVYVVMFVLSGTAITQMVLGALFLVYMQSEHRSVLCNACQAIKDKLRR